MIMILLGIKEIMSTCLAGVLISYVHWTLLSLSFHQDVGPTLIHTLGLNSCKIYKIWSV